MTNEKYETGAIRSGDAMGVDYWLITPIGLKRLTNIYRKYNRSISTINENVEGFYDNILEYLSGNRDNDYLAKAALHICELIAIDNNNLCWYRNIPIIALRRLAETYNEGKIKYCDYNCELGLPVTSTINHAMKHITDYMLEDGEKTDLPHALWNVLMAMHSEEMTPEINTMLRGPKCTLTEPIRQHVKETMEKKYGKQSNTSPGTDTLKWEPPLCRTNRDHRPSVGSP